MGVVTELSLSGAKVGLLNLGRALESPSGGHSSQDDDLTGLGCGVLGCPKY